MGGGEKRPWPYLLSHISMERLFISLSHLQHSDTAAVKDSSPQDSRSGRNDIESKVQRTTTKPFTISVFVLEYAVISNNRVLFLTAKPSRQAKEKGLEAHA